MGCAARAKPVESEDTMKPRRENGTAGSKLSNSARSFMRGLLSRDDGIKRIVQRLAAA